jgi:carboxylesterase
MKMRKIPRRTRVLQPGRRIELSGGDSAVLLFHGWTGWPARLAYLAARLNEFGFTVRVPRLPGHGTNVRDLLQTRADDWLRAATDEYLDLKDRFETVHVGGASMGAILATLVAARFGVGRVALLAPAFTNRNKLIVLTPFVKWLVPRVRGVWREENESNPDVVEISREYSTYNYTAAAAELRRLQRLGRRGLRELRSDTLVVASLADRTVPPSVVDLIERRSRARVLRKVYLDRSGHRIAEHVDRELVAGEVVRWFSSGA